MTISVIMASGIGSALASSSPTAPNVVDLNQEPGQKYAVQEQTQDSQRYAIAVKASNARVTIRVNDVPIFFKIFRSNETLDVPFNEWLKRGVNVVAFNAEKFDHDSTAFLNFNVYYQSPTQLINGDRLILFQSPSEVSLPVRQPVGIRAQTIPELRIWQTDRINPTSEEQMRLLDTIDGFRSRLVEAMGKADNAFMATFDKPMRDEINRAYGRLIETNDEILKRRIGLAAKFKEQVNAKLVTSPELHLEELNFEMIGDRRMVKVSRLDGRPLIDVSRGDMRYTIDKPIYGSVGGVWEMLRQ